MAYLIKNKDGTPAHFKGRSNLLGLDNFEKVADYSLNDRTVLMVGSSESKDRMGDTQAWRGKLGP